jgi:hypothetical protein
LANGGRIFKGESTFEEAQSGIENANEVIGRLAREMGDPGTISAIDAEYEAAARGLPETARLLVSDAYKSAGEGLSKEQWIAGVLRGHETHEDAQRTCLWFIVELWDDGPWPWQRTPKA